MDEISTDHVVNIQPDKDVILALDEVSGRELCKFEFNISGKPILFRTPLFSRYPGFLKKLANLFTLIAGYAPNIELPDNLTEAFNNPLGNEIWQRLSAVAVSATPQVSKLVIDLFFNYLDPQILHIKKRKWHTLKSDYRKWFIENARIEDIQKLFAVSLCVDDLVKKNARFLLQSEKHQQSQVESTKLLLVRNQKSRLNELTDTQSFSLEPL